MLVSLLAYARGAGVDARWVVIDGDDPFFALTKRIHNNLHGSPGDGGGLGEAERAIFDRVTERNAAEFRELVQPDDVVIIHDPQPAGLIPAIRDIGCAIIWRCHIGLDQPDELTRRAWRFLFPYVSEADAYVFSREAFTWEGLDRDRVELVAPSIDAFSPKNQELDADPVDSILAVAGLNEGWQGSCAPTFTNEDGSPGRVQRQATVWEGRPLRRDDRVVLQVSRWDALKDPLGVIGGFAEHVAPHVPDAHLVYAGPAVEAVADDPEGGQVLKDAQEAFRAMPPEIAERVHLVALPMDDPQENAAIVNALQRRADIVVQKSIAEGFGLTVAEGTPARGQPDRRHPGPDRGRRVRRAPRRPARPAGLRRGGARAARRPRAREGDRARGAGARARRVPRDPQPHAVPHALPAADRRAGGGLSARPEESGHGSG
jgi:trehalose synthase